ncbi:hypothetical protein L2E82_00455 [Cichorium intybus]|uniref:Uncharacterized protein n=1 Tax=Cichorium intybus TaxID=13427 RepID=A0ACB9GWU4_CICIN|nr:hypothetical protein L2E82_00455 [Cichorium intybus]
MPLFIKPNWQRLATFVKPNRRLIPPDWHLIGRAHKFLIESEKDPTNLSDEYLRDISLSLIIAGKDTSASTLTWFFYMLCKHPLIQEKVALEVKQSTGANYTNSIDEFSLKLTESSLEKMHYLHAALSETLILYPAVPLLRKSRRHLIVNPLDINDNLNRDLHHLDAPRRRTILQVSSLSPPPSTRKIDLRNLLLHLLLFIFSMLRKPQRILKNPNLGSHSLFSHRTLSQSSFSTSVIIVTIANWKSKKQIN